MSINTPVFKQLVAHFGGQTATAAAIGVKQPTVSGYLNGKWGMPPIVAIRAENATQGKFKASDLCPALKEFEQATA